MKPTILIVFLISISTLFGQDRSVSLESHCGVTINSSYLTGIGSISVAPTFFYYQNKHQFELGVGFHPFVLYYEKKFGGEFHYKYFTTGIEKRFNLFYLVSTSFTYNDHTSIMSGDSNRKENHLALLVGMGGQLKLSERLYLGLSLSIGASTLSTKKGPILERHALFYYYDFERAARLNVAYRF